MLKFFSKVGQFNSMKLINPETGYLNYVKIFREVQKGHKVVIWQVEEAGKRRVCETLLVSYNVDNKLMHFLPGDEILEFSLPVYFYIESEQIIFKSSIISLTPSDISVLFPAEMRLLDESDESMNFKKNHVSTLWVSKSSGRVEHINDFVKVKSMRERSSRDQDFLNTEFDPVSLDEEDKLFAEKRESPRVRPKADKLVRVVVKGETKLNTLKLFDLSRGGMGFLTFKPSSFPKGAEVFIMGFDTFDLDDPLVGTVMAHRAVDESNAEFKVGVRFNDGQE